MTFAIRPIRRRAAPWRSCRARCCSTSTCVIGMPYFTAVVSSARYWPKPPSPLIGDDLAAASGAAAHAPIAAGYREADRAEVARHQHGLAACIRSSGRTSTCCCRRRPRSPRRRARRRAAPRTRAADADAAPVGRRRRAEPSRFARPDQRARRPSARWSIAFDAPASRGSRKQAGGHVRCRPSTGTVDRMELAERSSGRSRPGRSACTAAMPVWFENDAPNTSRQSDSSISPSTRRGAAAAEHAARRAGGRRARCPWP